MHGSEGAGAWQHALATRRFQQRLKAGVGPPTTHKTVAERDEQMALWVDPSFIVARYRSLDDKGEGP